AAGGDQQGQQRGDGDARGRSGDRHRGVRFGGFSLLYRMRHFCVNRVSASIDSAVTLPTPMDTLTLLFPDLALIAIGQLLLRSGIWSRGFWQELEKMIYFLLFPALLFNTILRTNLGSAGALPAVTVALGAIAVGIALGFAARPLLRPLPLQFASGVQCAFRFNSYIMLALAQRFAGEPGLALAAIVMGVAVPILNVAAVWPLARTANSGLARELARNPLILATLAGLAGNFAGLSLPEPIGATIGRLGSASLALGLLAAGAGLRLE